MRISAPSFLLLALSTACYSSIPTDFDADPGSTHDMHGDETDDSEFDEAWGSTGDIDELEPTGPTVYASFCAPCHGTSAEGTALAYELRHPDRRLAEWVIRNGRSGVEFPDSQMPAFGPELISDAQLGELFDWLDDYDRPTSGEGLYRDYCANCHGADPRVGGVIREDILGEDDEDILDTVRDGDGDGIEPRSEYMTTFSPVALSDAEVQSIIDWMRTSG